MIHHRQTPVCGSPASFHPSAFLWGALALAGWLLIPRPVLAVDGLLEASGYWQEGRSGLQAYSSKNQRYRGFAGQRVTLSPDLWFNFRYGALVEDQENRTAASFTSYRRENQDPYLSLLYEHHRVEAGFYGNARRTDYFWSDQTSRRDDFLSGTGFAKWEGERSEAEARYTQSHSRRYITEGFVETRDRNLALNARTRLTDNDRLQYEFTRSQNDILTTGFTARYLTHRLDYNGDHAFLDERGRINLSARYKHLSQEISFGGDVTASYLQPDWGGFSLDDTPEYLDPLEPDPVPVPGLYDTDRDTPTVINIGDSAPVVREYGGDYRNIIFDFSDVVLMDSAILYIDTILNFPELMRWEVYVSDDPEGRDWGQPLGTDQVTWTYSQQANGRQGWVFRFADPVAHRRLKVVNYKLGPTEDDIFITEFEVYGPPEDTEEVVTTVNDHYRLNGTVDYTLAEDLNATYRGNFWWNTYGDSDRKDHNIGHFAGLVYSPGTWRIAGEATAGYRKTTSGRDTEIYTQRLSVSQRPHEDFDWRAGWNRTQDLSYDRNQITNDLTGDLSWRALPALTLMQRITYGVRNDHHFDLHSRAWTAVTQLRASPRRTFNFDLKRSSRWVSREAGSGFTTFNDTELRLTWAIFPYLTYAGLLRYQEREEDNWVRRSILSWSPLPGGSLTPSFYSSINEDTRAQTRQRAVGARATWRPRPRLMLEGGVEYSQFTNRDAWSNPVNYQARGYWTF